jgi:very-short-patch-repair endonuclease
MAQEWKVALAEWFRQHDGIVARPTLVDLGVSHAALRQMIMRGEIRRLGTGVYASGHVRIERRQLLQAVCQRNHDLAIGFTTAGQMWDLRKMRDPRIHVLVPHGCSPQLHGAIVHRCRDVADTDVVVLANGLRVTSPARTLFDASSIIGVTRTESALEQALDGGLVSFPAMVELCERLAKQARPGSWQMRSVLRGRPAWERAVQSDLEKRVLDAIRRRGLPLPIPQFELVLPDGKTIRFDFAWPAVKVALEVDHPFWHGSREAQHRDKKRDRTAIAMGWRVLRMTDWDVQTGMNQVAEDLRAALRMP